MIDFRKPVSWISSSQWTVEIVRLLLVLWMILGFGDLIHAGIFTSSDPDAFKMAIKDRTQNVVNFDSYPLTTIVNPAPVAFENLLFGYTESSLKGAKLKVSDGTPTLDLPLATVSGNRFLGSTAGEFLPIEGGIPPVTFTISFPVTMQVSAIGMYIVSDGVLQAGNIGIRVGNVESVVQPAFERTLSGSSTRTESYAYFVGLWDNDASASLATVTVFSTLNTGPASIGIDDITTAITAVPEPSSILLLGVGSLLGFVPLRKTVRRLSLRKIDLA